VYDADAVELRVLGCLIEKQRTTPDVYPLSLNSLRLACNQTTNRDPIVSYEEPEIRAALERLGRRGWTRLASASRAVKYRHLFDDAIGVDDEEISLLAVLMLRGPQTLGELKTRTERLHRFESLDAIENGLVRLMRRELVERRERRPGQKEERFAHLLGGEASAEPAPTPMSYAPPAHARDADGLEERVAKLEELVAQLRRELDALRG